ncbi:hypothetical protein OIU74_010958 [Salix koriyanagi]|uniref:Uncharacterized protein n=1 Tax=Salix koriyanagi TaxID=2511006 RepID=A0A9Q0TE50_9ROSI|nr:hypothetical protein OIU74_010958 [Salix koriyanagi]
MDRQRNATSSYLPKKPSKTHSTSPLKLQNLASLKSPQLLRLILAKQLILCKMSSQRLVFTKTNYLARSKRGLILQLPIR